MREAILPVFLPNAGCGSRCSFCNQTAVEGQTSLPGSSAVRAEIDKWLPRFTAVAPQLAFYGGTFTSLPENQQTELLELAKSFLNAGQLSGIRLSTRPDAVDEFKARQLAAYGVTVVEIGAQALVDSVLAVNNRRHTVADVFKTVRLLTNNGIRTGIHLMTGLPGDNDCCFLQTVAELLCLSPDYLRIHPTLVLEGTQLEKLLEAELYEPQPLSRAVFQCAWLKMTASAAGITVIRTGIQASDMLNCRIVAGPWHAAFGELVDSFCCYALLRKLISKSGCYFLRLNPSSLSKFNGQRRMNILQLGRRGIMLNPIPDDALGGNEFIVGETGFCLENIIDLYSYDELALIAEEWFETTGI